MSCCFMKSQKCILPLLIGLWYRCVELVPFLWGLCWCLPPPVGSCPGQAVVLCPSRAFGRWCLVTQGGYCVPRLLPWLLHNLLLLTWNLIVSEILRMTSQPGYTVNFFFYLILLFLSCLPFPFCYCLQAKYISWKIPFSIRLRASPRKKYFCLQKKRELGNNSINSNCNTIATTNC